MNRRDFIKTSGALALTPAATATATKTSKAGNVLVLGGTGYFGPVLVEELVANGYSVTLFNRGKTNPHLFPNLKRIVGDRETVDGSGLSNLEKNPQQWDWVVDTWQGSSKAVADTATILSERTKQYQYVSTVSVYDKWDRIGIDESEPLNPLPSEYEEIVTPNRYAIRKTFSELALRKLMPNRSVFFRSHGMRGYPTSAAKHEPYWQVKIARQGKLVAPTGIDYYQVTDMVSLARFMIHCGKRNINGPFNVCYPPMLFRDFINGIVDNTNSQVDIHWIPQEFLVENGVKLMRDTPAGRYRFNVDHALKSGLVNRPLSELLSDQLRGYSDRYPDDDFKFGHPETSTISDERELEVIRLWDLANETGRSLSAPS